jgi:hypothetical protein
MDKKIAGLLGAAAAIATISGAHASTQPQSQPTTTLSYRDLLEPVPDAVAALKADDVRLAETPAVSAKDAGLQVAQWHHHHHHHHHHGFFLPIPVPGYGPPCHWVWGRPYWNGYRWIRPRVRVCR